MQIKAKRSRRPRAIRSHNKKLDSKASFCILIVDTVHAEASGEFVCHIIGGLKMAIDSDNSVKRSASSSCVVAKKNSPAQRLLNLENPA